MGKQDEIYSSGNLSGLPFSFNKEVTEVFENMIDRSVPGYKTSMKLIELHARKYLQNDTNCYDLGCSLGAATKAMLDSAEGKRVRILSIDNSKAMIDKCIKNFVSSIQRGFLEFREEDIMKTDIQNASLVVLNFVLQFLDLDKRDILIKNIYRGLNPGGALIISEKIHYESDQQTLVTTSLHHSYKAQNGYSEMEIAGKRDALEGVLITETEKALIKRMTRIGFRTSEQLMLNLNFTTYLFTK